MIRTQRLLWCLPVLAAVTAGCVQPLEEDSGQAGNRDPVILGLHVRPTTIRVGTSTTVTVDATDPDNNLLSYGWRATTGDIIGQGSTIRFTASFCCTGTNFVEVTVRDGAGGSATQTVEVLITN